MKHPDDRLVRRFLGRHRSVLRELPEDERAECFAEDACDLVDHARALRVAYPDADLAAVLRRLGEALLPAVENDEAVLRVEVERLRVAVNKAGADRNDWREWAVEVVDEPAIDMRRDDETLRAAVDRVLSNRKETPQ